MPLADQWKRDTLVADILAVNGVTVAGGASAFNEIILSCRMWNVGGSGVAYIVSHLGGEIIDARIQLDGAISGNDPQFNLRDAQGAAISQMVVDSSAQSAGDTHAWTLPADPVYVGRGTPLSVSWNGNTTGNVDGTVWVRVRYEADDPFYWVCLGNSNARDATEGYVDLGGRWHWPILSIFNNGGGLVSEWARPTANKYSIYREGFAYGCRRYGAPRVIWWNIYCDDDDGSRSDTSVRQADIDDMESVIAFFEEHAPGAVIYVSGPNDYNGITCTSIGTHGLGAANNMADWLIANKGFQRGPVVPELNSGNAAGDSCHPSADGHLEQGERLLRFFDGGGVINGPA